jgi:hypothetical protein
MQQGHELGLTAVANSFEDDIEEKREKSLVTHFGDGCAYTKVLYLLLIVCRVQSRMPLRGPAVRWLRPP